LVTPFLRKGDRLIVHVSAPASARADVRYANVVRNILAWEPEKRAPIYPPPQLHLPASPEIPTNNTQGRSPAEPANVQLPEDPSQVPDSQPKTPEETQMRMLDIVTESPLQGAQKWFDSDERNVNVASKDGVLSPGEEFVQRIFQRVPPPPQPTSLDRYPFSSTDQSQGADSQLPLFTSTPKSRPLKSLLPKTVNTPSLDTELTLRKNSKSRFPCLKSIVLISRLSREISAPCFRSVSSAARLNHAHYKTGSEDFGE
jgi:hypothetical protein